MSEASSRRRALVTGGTTGIGLGIATAMADAGYEVTATGLTDEQVAAVPRRQHLSAVKLDVTSADSVAAVLEPFRELAALINCAGIIFRGGAEYDMANFQKVIDVNLTGTMRMCVGARAKLAPVRGSIVNTASMLSYFGGPLIPAYTASKGGVAQLTKALAVAWAPEGIRVMRLLRAGSPRSLREGWLRMRTGLLLSYSAHLCSVGVSRETLRGRLCFFVPKRHASSRARSCPSMEATRQYESEGLPMSNLTVNVAEQSKDARVPTGIRSRRNAFLSWSSPTPSQRMSVCGSRRWRMCGSARCAYPPVGVTG